MAATVDEDIGHRLTVTAAVMQPFALVTFLLRVYVRAIHGNKLGWDDYVMSIATCTGLITTAFSSVAAAHGFGRHAQFLSPSDLIVAVKYIFLAELGFIITATLIKMSVCLFLLRIIEGTHKRFAYVVWVVFTTNLLLGFVTSLLWGLQSRPITGLWDHRVQAARLSTAQVVDVNYVTSVFLVITDIFCALSPIHFLRNLQMGKGRKIGLLVLMGLGVLTSAVGIIKIAYLKSIKDPKDLTYTFITTFLLSNLERNTGETVANLPTLRFLFSRLIDMSQRNTSSKTTLHPTEALREHSVAHYRTKASSGLGPHEDDDQILLQTISAPPVTAHPPLSLGRNVRGSNATNLTSDEDCFYFGYLGRMREDVRYIDDTNV